MNIVNFYGAEAVDLKAIVGAPIVVEDEFWKLKFNGNILWNETTLGNERDAQFFGIVPGEIDNGK